MDDSEADMRSILLLEPDTTAGRALLPAAAAAGLDVVAVTQPEQYAEYAAELVAQVSDVILVDFDDAPAALEAIARRHAESPLAGVVSGHEFFAGLATVVARRLGLPGNDPRGASAVRNKGQMSARFHAAGVPAPIALVARTAAEAQTRLTQAVATGRLGLPVVVKPLENGGSVGVTVVSDLDELAAAVARAQEWPRSHPHGMALDRGVLIQQCAEGDEVSVESVVFRGRVDHVALTHKLVTDGPHRAELGHTIPAALTASQHAQVEAAAAAAITALGITNGIAHTEIKVDADRVAVIEVGARLPGGHLVELVQAATGYDLATAYIDIATGHRPPVSQGIGRSAGIRFLHGDRAGHLAGVDGLPEPSESTSWSLYLGPGSPVGPPTDNTSRVGHILHVGSDPAAVDQTLAELVSGVSVRAAA